MTHPHHLVQHELAIYRRMTINRDQFMPDMEWAWALSTQDKRQLLAEAAVYRHGDHYMGSMATAALMHALGGEYGRDGLGQLIDGADDVALDVGIVVASNFIGQVRQQRAKKLARVEAAKMVEPVREAYRRLADMLSDAIEGGRLTEADIPDDYLALTDLLEKIAGLDPARPGEKL